MATRSKHADRSHEHGKRSDKDALETAAKKACRRGVLVSMNSFTLVMCASLLPNITPFACARHTTRSSKRAQISGKQAEGGSMQAVPSQVQRSAQELASEWQRHTRTPNRATNDKGLEAGITVSIQRAVPDSAGLSR